jgi:hypothetical protein
MKTFVPLKQSLLTSILVIFISVSCITSNAQVTTGLQLATVSVGATDKAPVGTPANKLASFTASLNNNKVDLKWTTEAETNLSHIMVEKSIDGKNFKDAALVFTYGNTTSRSDYAFADHIGKTGSASVYYRLRSVDTDGTTRYSETLTVEISKEADRGVSTILANISSGKNETKNITLSKS